MLKYSLIVPVFQCRSFLPACVESILSQQEPDLELLLIDDGSRDGSGVLCDELAARDPRIRVFHKQNSGAASARNLGLDHAKGEYVLFIDGDDTIASDCLTLLSEEKTRSGLTIFGMSFDYYRKERLVRKERLSCAYDGSYDAAQIAEQFDGFFYDNQLSSACNKCFQRRMIEANGLRFREGMTLYEDFDFVLRYLCCAGAAVCIPQPLYHYRHTLPRPRLNSRLSDLDRVRENLGALNRSLLAFYRAYPANAVLTTAANLYMQLLDQHLTQRSSFEQHSLQEALSAYGSEPSFLELLDSGARLNASSSLLLNRIRDGQYSDLVKDIRRRKRKRLAKRIVKRFLRT